MRLRPYDRSSCDPVPHDPGSCDHGPYDPYHPSPPDPCDSVLVSMALATPFLMTLVPVTLVLMNLVILMTLATRALVTLATPSLWPWLL